MLNCTDKRDGRSIFVYSKWPRKIPKYILATRQISGGEQQFKHQLAQKRVVWGERPFKCKRCKLVIYNNYFGDAIQYTINAHPFFGLTLAPKGHPYSKRERFIVLLIGIMGSFSVAVLFQQWQYAPVCAIVVGALQVIAEECATCACCQNPRIPWIIREFSERIGNYVQAAIFLAVAAAMCGSMLVYMGKNGLCFPMQQSGKCQVDTVHCPVMNTSFSGEMKASFIADVYDIDCYAARNMNPDCMALEQGWDCLQHGSIREFGPVLRQIVISLMQAWLIYWPAGHMGLLHFEHRRQTNKMIKKQTYFPCTTPGYRYSSHKKCTFCLKAMALNMEAESESSEEEVVEESSEEEDELSIYHKKQRRKKSVTKTVVIEPDLQANLRKALDRQKMVQKIARANTGKALESVKMIKSVRKQRREDVYQPLSVKITKEMKARRQEQKAKELEIVVAKKSKPTMLDRVRRLSTFMTAKISEVKNDVAQLGRRMSQGIIAPFMTPSVETPDAPEQPADAEPVYRRRSILENLFGGDSEELKPRKERKKRKKKKKEEDGESGPARVHPASEQDVPTLPATPVTNHQGGTDL